jgi:hypothetical protein
VEIILILRDFGQNLFSVPYMDVEHKWKLNYLHAKLQSVLSLVRDKKKLQIQFFITLHKRSHIWYEWTRNGKYGDERLILNVLEALKAPIYAILHGGGKVTLKIYDSQAGCSPELIHLFHLTPAEWQKVRPTTSSKKLLLTSKQEQEDHIERWGSWSPENNYLTDVREDRPGIQSNSACSRPAGIPMLSIVGGSSASQLLQLYSDVGESIASLTRRLKKSYPLKFRY